MQMPDDTTLSTTLEIVFNTTLNSELNAISYWLKLNKLSLNAPKS